MQVKKNRNKSIAIAIFLSIVMCTSMMLIPTAKSHTPSWNIPTFAYINAAPNPVGVGQQVLVVFWLDKTFDPSIAVSNDWRFHNYNLTVIAPNGDVNSTIFPYISDTTSSQFITYTPNQVGNYTLIFNFPGQAYNQYDHNPASVLVNDMYLPSSASVTLDVQSTPLPAAISSFPLPADYWTRPIYGENNLWWTIASNWLGGGAPGYAGFSMPESNQQSFIPDAIGPLTGHVMWTKPLQSGGVVGGNNFVIPGDTYFEGSAYNQRFANPIVLNGKLYYTEPVSFTGVPNNGFGAGSPYGPTDCVDLRTGQLIWSRSDVPALSFGYIYDVQDPNQHGVYPAILFTSNFGEAFDADTGDWLFNVTNVPSGTEAMGVNGEQLRYVLTNTGTPASPNWSLGEWNSSKLWSYNYPPNLSPTLTGFVTTPSGTAVDASISNQSNPSVRYDWSVSLPFANPMPLAFNPFGPSYPFTVFAAFYDNMLLCYNGTLPGVSTSLAVSASSTPYTYFAIDVNTTHSTFGQVLWWNTLPAPPGNVTVLTGVADPTVGVFTEAYRETRQWVGYSMATGQKLWGPTASQTAFDYYGNTGISYVQGVAAYGKLYSSQYGGILYCYDLSTGNLLWTYGTGGEGNSTFSSFYTAYNHYPTFVTAIGNGVVYLITSEHTATSPIYKGALTRAVNATNGSEIWTLSDYTSYLAGPATSPTSYAIADGYATFFNGYDDQIYSVGRGPSSTTVTAGPKFTRLGDNVVIEGTVMDVSAGTKQNEQAADFPNGVPCPSDASMKDWMGYVYQQKPEPTNFTGVQVSLTVVDPNNNTFNVATPTTTLDGTYSYVYTPTVPGTYTMYATFSGTNGYWSSLAMTTFDVGSATTSATPAVSNAPASNTNTYVIGSAIAIIIVLIIIGALNLLSMKKRS